MCVISGAALGTAAALSANIGLATTAVSTALTIAGMQQGQQQAQASMNFQAAQTAQQQDLAYRQAQQATDNDRRQQLTKYNGQVAAQQAAYNQYNKTVGNTNDGVNRVYTQEQAKLLEVRDKAAFKAQENYAKAIGAKGRILAGGQTGQSIGLLALNEDRQLGFANAQENATISSAETQSQIAMGIGYDQAVGSINTAFSQVPQAPQAPVLAPNPIGIGKNLNLGIPNVPAYS
jgi:hypothetical protein